MSTAILSDLHLGSRSSLLSRPEVRDALLKELEQVDEIVLLGDLLALREAPLAQVLEAARPWLDELGDAFRDRRVMIVPGNHDYQLAQPLLENRRLYGAPTPFEVRSSIERNSVTSLGFVASRLRLTDVTLAYPGIWVRPDVYATHGHYLDCHLTVPRRESVLASLMKVLTGGLPTGALSPDDYEAALAPIYAFAYERAQAAGSSADRAGRSTPRLWKHARSSSWERVEGDQVRRGRPKRRPGARLLGGAALVGGVAAMNLAGFGPFKTDLSRQELDRAGLRAMREVVERLELDAKHVVFGHTHRMGPFGDEPGWTLPNGTQLYNPGSWVYSRRLIGDAGRLSPYWPGGCAFVGDTGPPVVRGLLDELTIGPR